MVLASVLLGVPRALDARAFGAQESVYVEVSPLAPELRDFASELERALVRASVTLSSRRSKATIVVDVLSVARAADAAGRPVRAVGFVVGDARRRWPLVLHYAADGAEEAVRELLWALGPSSGRES